MHFLKLLNILLFLPLFSCEISTVRAPHLRNVKVETYYIGLLPCEDCDDLETIIKLKKDQTYIINQRFLGKEDHIQFETEGPFNWLEDGTIIHLLDYEGPSYYKIDSLKMIELNEDLSYRIGSNKRSYNLLRDEKGVTVY